MPPIVALASPYPKHAMVNVTMNGMTVGCIVKDRGAIGRG